jgi:hypothetical protein
MTGEVRLVNGKWSCQRPGKAMFAGRGKIGGGCRFRIATGKPNGYSQLGTGFIWGIAVE